MMDRDEHIPADFHFICLVIGAGLFDFAAKMCDRAEVNDGPRGRRR